MAEKDRDLFLASGAVGNGAIYTQPGHRLHIVRKVIVAVGSLTNWLVLKLQRHDDRASESPRSRAVRASVAMPVLFAGISGCILLPPPSTEN